MAISQELIRERLRSAFGSESQETIAGKLNMSQGNVSKLLSGSQLPALDTLCGIAEIYNVSVDWLLGLSEQMKIRPKNESESYALTTEVITNAIKRGGEAIFDGNPWDVVTIKIKDPLLKFLLNKSLVLSRTDNELCSDWKSSKLSEFDEWPLVYESTWREDPVCFLASEAKIESDWIQVLEEAKRLDEEFAEIMGDDLIGPFGR